MRVAPEVASVPPFRPLPLMARPHVQTIVAAAFNLTVATPSALRRVKLPDGDEIALEVSTPRAWRPDDSTVVMIHGLCGCSRSPYLRRMARKLYRRGVRAVRMNLRGCGPGKGLARQLYHSGRSEDALAVVKDLRAEWPDSPLTLIGFSLGGNIALKLAGELGAGARGLLSQVIAVCPPVDLVACSRRLALPANRLYERSFLKVLRNDVALRHAAFPDLPAPVGSDAGTLFEFDDHYTAPQCGFEGALDYYARCASAPLVTRIVVSCRILLAEDDPLIDSTVLHGMKLPPNLCVARTDRGGHMGFLGVPGLPGGFYWMDSLLLDWLKP